MSARTQHRLRPFWIHLQYGRSKSERVLEFNPRGFSTVNDVLKRMKYAHSDLYLCNEHGERLEYEHILEKARTYILKRQPIRQISSSNTPKMVDVFGGSRRSQGRGPRGPRGARGIPGSIKDFCKWMPNSILTQLQNHEEFCYILSSSSDVKGKDGKITEWLCRNKDNSSFIAEIPSELIKIKDNKFALDFKRNRYKSTGQNIFTCEYGCGHFCITFRIDAGEDLQAVVTNYHSPDPLHDFHEIAATTNEIRILGYQNGKPSFVTLQHNCREWTTLFIEYQPSSSGIQGTAMLNNDPTTREEFSFQMPLGFSHGVCIGSRSDGNKFLTGAIHAVESYFREGITEELPPELKKLVIENQMIT